jgi:hypothetical protein
MEIQDAPRNDVANPIVVKLFNDSLPCVRSRRNPRSRWQPLSPNPNQTPL